MKAKRLIKLLLAAVVCTSLFSGCTKSVKENGAEFPNLVFYVPMEKQPDSEVVNNEINTYIKDKIEATLDLQCIDPGAYTQRMNMMAASGKKYDICFTGYVNPMEDAVKNGCLLELDDLIEKYASDAKKNIPDYAWEAAKYDGKTYAVPNVQSYTLPLAVYVQKDYLDKYNFDLNSVKHIEELEPLFEKIKANESNVWAYQPSFGFTPWISDKYESVGPVGELYIERRNEKPTVKKIYETPEFLQGVKKLRDWYNKGYIRNDIISATLDNVSASKTVAVPVNWKYGGEVTYSNNIGHTVLEKVLCKPIVSRGVITQTMLAIGNKSKSPEKSMQLINLMQTDKHLYNMFCFGIEGKHYKKTGDNHIEVNEGSRYSPKCDFVFGNQFNAYLTKNMSDDTWKKSEEMNEQSEKSVLLDFHFDISNVKNEISAVSNVTPKYRSLKFGCDDVDKTLAAYKSELVASGIDKIAEELQKQIDEYVGK